ncbi:MAG: thiamine phosphate synthase [Gemmatimonadales bacterium]|nr:thiamine phosphate synthase [Gemmatimonadales bacterium]
MTHNLASMLRLLLVTDDALLAGHDPVARIAAAVAGGVTAVQLRLKHASAAELAALGRRLLATLPVPLFLNDRLDVALAIGAAGVHLGPDDVPVAAARRIAPAGFVLGASVGLEAELANGAAADYWGVGPWAATGTKADAGAALGADGFRRFAARAGARPCVAIGGVRPEHVAPALAAGAAGVAVVSGILASTDPTAAARAYAVALPGASGA